MHIYPAYPGPAFCLFFVCFVTQFRFLFPERALSARDVADSLEHSLLSFCEGTTNKAKQQKLTTAPSPAPSPAPRLSFVFRSRFSFHTMTSASSLQHFFLLLLLLLQLAPIPKFPAPSSTFPSNLPAPKIETKSFACCFPEKQIQIQIQLLKIPSFPGKNIRGKPTSEKLRGYELIEMKNNTISARGGASVGCREFSPRTRVFPHTKNIKFQMTARGPGFRIPVRAKQAMTKQHVFGIKAGICAAKNPILGISTGF